MDPGCDEDPLIPLLSGACLGCLVAQDGGDGPPSIEPCLSQSTDCVGEWSACSESCEQTYSVTTLQSGRGEPCIAPPGAVVLCEPGVDSCPAPGDICTAGSGVRDFYSGGANFDTATTVAELGVIECSAGNGRSDASVAPDALCTVDGSFVFRGCEQNVDCLGSWSTCGEDCADSIYTVERPASGAGFRCTAAQGDMRSCEAGQGDCPADVDCIGSWGSCSASCEKTYTVTIQQSGRGSQCSVADASTSSCHPGEDECPPNVDCVGSFTACARDCRPRVFEVETAQSGQGAACSFAAGDEWPCNPGDGQCPLNTDCVGGWSTCAETCVKTYMVTTAQSGQGTACVVSEQDNSPVADGAVLLCEPGVDSCPAPGDICTAGSGVRDFYSGGANFDTATTVAELGVIECSAGNGRSDASVAPDALCTVDGSFVFRGCEPTSNCLGSFSTCTADCSDRVYTINVAAAGGGYECPYEQFDTVPCAAGQDDCPPDIDCVGSWSECSSECDDKVFVVETAQSGRGSECVAANGARLSCSPGEGDCPLDIDCIGSWSACAADCAPKVYTISTQASGNGRACESPDQGTHVCAPGEDYCPPDVDCVGSWGECSSACQVTFSVAVAQSGQGAQCTVSADDLTTVSHGDQAPCNPGVGACPEAGDTCVAASGNSAGYTGGVNFDTATTVADLGVVSCAAGFGRIDPDIAPSALCTTGPAADGVSNVGEFLFRGCAPNVNCAGSWSTCPEDCSDKMFMITTFQSGQGARCRWDDGVRLPCQPGEGQCPEDIDCIGRWSPCNAQCDEKQYEVIRPRSGNGLACPAVDQDQAQCQPGEGLCPPNVDCVGGWSTCDATCTKVFSVYIEKSGEGAECEASTGDEAPCAAESTCDDGNDKSMDDQCTAGDMPECKGVVAIGGGLEYSIAMDAVPEDGPERLQLETGIKGNLAGVISAGGMECEMKDIKVLRIAQTAAEGRRRLQEGVEIDYTVSVSTEFATPEAQASAAQALADPPPGTSMDISIGGVTAGAPLVEPFHTYAWVKVPVGCPTECGNDASSISDSYICERDDEPVEQSICEANDIELPATWTQCPVTDDCDCIGSWSACDATCSDQTYSITRPVLGNVGNGVQCEANAGDLDICLSGEDQCTDVDCEGAWSTTICDADCSDRRYTITTPRVLDGASCPAEDGDLVFCFPGEGECPLPPVQIDIEQLDDHSTTTYTATVVGAISAMSASDDTPVVEVRSQMTFATITVDAINQDRDAFEIEFKEQVANQIGSGVPADSVYITGIAPGSVVIDFFLLAPASVQAEAAALVAAIDATQVTVTIDNEAISASGAVTPVVQAVDNVDCVGSWATCAADCSDKVYSVSTAQSGLGTACAILDGAAAACSAGDGDCVAPAPPPLTPPTPPVSQSTASAASPPPAPPAPESSAGKVLLVLGLVLLCGCGVAVGLKMKSGGSKDNSEFDEESQDNPLVRLFLIALLRPMCDHMAPDALA